MRFMQPARDCFVAHFDMLGMASLIEADLDRAWILLDGLDRARTTVADAPLPQSARARIREIVFSDTMLIVTDRDQIADLHAVIARSLEFFRAALEASIPIRGGIAFGKMVIAEEPLLFTGSALLRAYRIGESQQMLGVSLDDESAKRFRQEPFRFGSGVDVIVDWDTPTRSGVERRAILNWPAFCHLSFVLGIPSNGAALRARFIEQPDPTAQAKYEHTLEFIIDRGRAGDLGRVLPPTLRS